MDPWRPSWGYCSRLINLFQTIVKVPGVAWYLLVSLA